MITQNDSARPLQARNGLDETKITITEVANKQHGIRLQLVEQLLVVTGPVTVKVSGYGEAQSGQEWCLGFGHPARCGQNV